MAPADAAAAPSARKRVGPLTEAEIRGLKARARPYRVTDGAGLFLEVARTGRKTWYFRYERQVAPATPGDAAVTRETSIKIGTWPEMGGWDARRIRDNMKLQRSDQIDPVAARRAERAPAVLPPEQDGGPTLHALCEQLLKESRPTGDVEADRENSLWSVSHYARTRSAIETFLYPHKGADGVMFQDRGVKTITSGDFVHLARALQGRDASGKAYARETARKACMHLRMVMNRAVADQLVPMNPGVGLSGVIKSHRRTPRASLPASQLGEFLRALEVKKAEAVTRIGVKLMIHIFVRTKELRFAEWPEFDFKERIWRIPAVRMKNNLPFDVPLSPQVVSLLKTLHQVTGRQKFVLGTPWKRSRGSLLTQERPISDNTMQKLVSERMGYEITVHGFRATARTVFSQNGWSRGASERQLSHREKNQTVAAYDRAEHWPERVAMMGWWSNYVEAMEKDMPPPKGPGAWMKFVEGD